MYAPDLATRQVRWTYPEPGQLALSPNDILYVMPPPDSNGRSKLVAINLR